MKHLRIPLLCLLLCFALVSSAFAMDYVPDSFQAENINGIQRIVKNYTLPPDVNPGNLWEPSFAYDGYYYTWAYTTKEENAYELTKEVTETQTVETEKKDLEEILELLPNRIEYDDGEYKGWLALDHSSLVTEVSSYVMKYTSVTETKTFPGLISNDMSCIPSSTVKNGLVLPLTNVDWQVTATALVGEDLVPSMYQAVATYSAMGNYNAPVGYVTTASYMGTVTDAGIENIVYTVVFTGEPIQPIETEPPSPPPEEVQPTEVPVETALPVERTQRSEDGFNIWSILGAVPLLLFVAVLIILILRQKNVLVYVPGDKPKEYRLVGKYRASARIPRIDIGNINPRPDGIVAVEIKQSLAKKLLGRDFTVRCGNREYTYRVRRDQPSDWHEYNIETLEEVQN